MNQVEFNKILETFKDFTEGTRVMFLLHRSKEGGKNNKHKRHLRKVIVSGKDQFTSALELLMNEKDASKEPLRIYCSVNERNVEHGIRKFKMGQLLNDYVPEDLRHSFYFDIKNRFISALCSPESKKTKYFLYDFDGACERSIITWSKQIEKVTKIKIVYATKNGYHIITEPFNPNDLKDCPAELNKDGLLLLSY